MGWMVWFQLFFLLCMVWFGFGAVLKPLAALCVCCCLCGSSKESVVIFFMLDQKCVIFNWNVRGLNNAARRQVVFNSARDYSATIVALQETKLANIDRQVVFEVLGSRFVDNFLVLPADGTRGGILVAVDEY
jgi:hypothetical protein